MIFDTELRTEFLVSGIVKLFGVVTDDDSGDSKPINDGPPCKVAYILLSNLF